MPNQEINNVLFTVQNENVEEVDKLTSENIESVYNVKIYSILLRIYMALLFCQYLLIYACVPFDNIENRPSIIIITDFYCIFMFSVNACTLPICSTKIPTLPCLRCLIIASIFEGTGVVLNLVSVIVGLRVEEMFSFEYSSYTRGNRKVNVTTYIQITSILALAFNAVAFCICIFNASLISHGLKNLLNKIDRRSENRTRYTYIEKEFPTNIIKEQRKCFIP